MFKICKVRAKCQKGRLQTANGMDLVADSTELSAGVYFFTPAESAGAAGQGAGRFHVGPFSMHITTLPDMAARSSAIPFGYWIGHLVLHVGSVLRAVPGLQADGVCSRMTMFSQPDDLSVHPVLVNSSTLHMHGVYTAFDHLAAFSYHISVSCCRGTASSPM
ncbi:hypothetical protein ABBQ38_014080 [Trebouxia sp. C0009 RCD-2024]